MSAMGKADIKPCVRNRSAMAAIIVTVVFFVGLTLAIICGMLSASRQNPLWYLPTVLYAVLINLFLASQHNKHLDYVATILSALFLILMGWFYGQRMWTRDR